MWEAIENYKPLHTYDDEEILLIRVRNCLKIGYVVLSNDRLLLLGFFHPGALV